MIYRSCQLAHENGQADLLLEKTFFIIMPLDFCQSNIIVTKILLVYETFYTSIKKEVKYNYMSSKAGENMANIREIAKRAGVSVSTVSRVLNGYPYVKSV